MDISGKHFLVVGASGVLGSLIAKRLADGGATLTIAGRDEEALVGVGLDDAHIMTADLREPDAPRALVDGAREHHGSLDGVVIASGIVAFGPTAEIDDDTVDDLVLVDFLAPLRLTRAALGALEKGGVIANISAVVAEKPVGNMATYSAVKAAVSALYAGARPEARRQKIRLLDIRPPHTETGLVDRAIAGDAPKMPDGIDPASVADRILAALSSEDTEIASSEFS